MINQAIPPAILAALLAWSVCACGQQGGAGGPAPATATVPATPSGNTATIRLSRSGGLNARAGSYIIEADGDVQLSDGRTLRPSTPEAPQQLAAQIDATGIYNLPPGTYQPDMVCCDRYTYVLTLWRDGKQYEYTTTEGVQDAPPVIFLVIEIIQDYARAAAHPAERKR